MLLLHTYEYYIYNYAVFFIEFIQSGLQMVITIYILIDFQYNEFRIKISWYNRWNIELF